MEGKHEYVPSATEIAEAESKLTPEYRVASNARYEIRRHKEVLESVGVTKTQIDEASVLASEKAVREYHELERQEPWNRTMGIIEKVKERLSPDERLLIEGLTSWSRDFVFRWKERIDMARSRLGQNAAMSEIVRDIRQNGAPSSLLQEGEPLQDYPAFLLFSPKARSLVDPEAKKKREEAWKQDQRMPVTQLRKPFGQGEPWGEVIRPTKEGVVEIFEAFGAELPSGNQTEARTGWGEDPLIPTQSEGVYLTLSPSGDSVRLAFDIPTLVRMINARKELESIATE